MTDAIDITPYIGQTIERLKETLCTLKWTGTFVDGNGDISFHRNGIVIINAVDHTWDVKVDQSQLKIIIHNKIDGVEDAGLVRATLRLDAVGKRLFGADWKQPSFTSQLKSPEFHKIAPFADYLRYARVLATVDNDLPEDTPPTVFYTKQVRRQKVDMDYRIDDEISREARKSIDKALSKRLPAIVLACCDRPDYFAETLDTLAANPQFEEWPVLAFMDCPSEPKNREYQTKQAGLLRKYKPDAAIVARSENWGCGRNLIDARRQAFSKLGFGRAYVFEDDMPVSPAYISLCENIWEWAAKCGYYDIGAVQAWNHRYYPAGELEKAASYVKSTHSPYWWGYSMSHLAWKAIEPQMVKFARDFLNCQYNERDHRAIVQYFAKTLAPSPAELREFDDQPEYPTAPDCEKEWKRFLDEPTTGQDGATTAFFHQAGFRRLTASLSRAKTIGRNGIHFTPDLFRQAQFEKTPCYVDQSDMTRSEFIEEIERVSFMSDSAEFPGMAVRAS